MKRSYYKYPAFIITALLAVTFVAGVVSAGAQGVINCAECGMAVDPDGPFASRMEYPDGRTEWFCDLGDMMLHYDGLGEEAGAVSIFVKDYPSNSWTDGRKAFYLTGSNVKTPMRYDIIAFSDSNTAEAFKAKSGGDRVVGFDEAMSGRVFTE